MGVFSLGLLHRREKKVCVGGGGGGGGGCLFSRLPKNGKKNIGFKSYVWFIKFLGYVWFSGNLMENGKERKYKENKMEENKNKVKFNIFFIWYFKLILFILIHQYKD